MKQFIPTHNPPPLPQPVQQQPIQRTQQSYQSSRSSSIRNDNRRESSRWHEPSSSSHHSVKQRTYERDTDKYNSRKEKDYSRDRDRERERDRDRERDRERERDRPRDRDRNHRGNCDDRGRNYDRNKSSSQRRSRSRSQSRSFSKEPSRSKSEHHNNYRRNDNSRSHSSQPRSSSSKRDVAPTKPIEEDSRNLGEKVATQNDENKTERARILEKWRSNFCETSEDIARKLEELAEDSEKECWIRSSPADLYYKRASVNEIEGTARLEALCTLFTTELVERGKRARQNKPIAEAQPKKRLQRICRHKSKWSCFVVYFGT